MNIIVAIADMKVSSNPTDTLTTYSLGSCVAVVVYDPLGKIGGMIHIMLPDSAIERDINNLNPYKFVDTGIPRLYKEMFARGAKRSGIVTKLVGGASVMDKRNVFNIGNRNYAAIRKILWRNNVLISSEDVGGVKSRTVALDIATGRVIVRNAHEEYEI